MAQKFNWFQIRF